MNVVLPAVDQTVMTVQAYAALFGVSESAVRRSIENGTLSGSKVSEKLYRVYVSAPRDEQGD